jgi:hypothetical protein
MFARIWSLIHTGICRYKLLYLYVLVSEARYKQKQTLLYSDRYKAHLAVSEAMYIQINLAAYSWGH